MVGVAEPELEEELEAAVEAAPLLETLAVLRGSIEAVVVALEVDADADGVGGTPLEAAFARSLALVLVGSVMGPVDEGAVDVWLASEGLLAVPAAAALELSEAMVVL